jgi:hypothetical protein
MKRPPQRNETYRHDAVAFWIEKLIRKSPELRHLERDNDKGRDDGNDR